MAERDRGGYAPAVLGHHPRHLGARRVRPGRAPRGYRPASYLHRVGALINARNHKMWCRESPGPLPVG